MSKYQILRGPEDEILPLVLRVKDRAFIPEDPRNSDYLEYLKWVAEGNDPLPFDAILPPVEYSFDPNAIVSLAPDYATTPE